MHIFTINLKLYKPRVLVCNLSGNIECRLSKTILDNPQKLLKQIRKKINDDFSIQVTDVIEYLDNGDILIYIIRNIARGILVDKIRSQFKCCVINNKCNINHDNEFHHIACYHQNIACYHYNHYNYNDNIIPNNQVRHINNIHPSILPDDFVEFENDLDLFTYLISINGLWIQFASRTFRLDKGLIFKATKYNGNAFYSVPYNIDTLNITTSDDTSNNESDDMSNRGSNDISNDRLTYQYDASLVSKFNEFWDDEEVIQRCIKYKYYEFKHLSYKIRSKYAKEFVYIYIHNIEFVPHDVPNYLELCIYSISNRRNIFDKDIYKKITPEMLNNIDVIKALLLSSEDNNEIKMIKNRELIAQIDYSIIKSCIVDHIKQFQSESMYNSESMYDYLPYSLRIDMVLLKLSIPYCKFKSIPRKLRQNHNLIDMYLANSTYHSNPDLPMHILRRFSIYKKICMSYCKRNNLYRLLSKKQQRNRNFVLETVKNKLQVYVGELLPNKYLDDEEIVQYILKYDNSVYQYISIFQHVFRKLNYLQSWG